MRMLRPQKMTDEGSLPEKSTAGQPENRFPTRCGREDERLRGCLIGDMTGGISFIQETVPGKGWWTNGEKTGENAQRRQVIVVAKAAVVAAGADT